MTASLKAVDASTTDLATLMAGLGRDARAAARVLAVAPTLQKNAALAAMAKAIRASETDILKANATGPRETFWFAKAGFDAAALLESRQQWKSAVGIYEKMTAIPGPHAEQARQRIRKLRLEHFLWD